jgi:hypothetical protein
MPSGRSRRFKPTASIIKVKKGLLGNTIYLFEGVTMMIFLNAGSYDSINHSGHRRRFMTCSLIIEVKKFFQVL